MNGLIQRISTAVIFVLVMLGGLYGGRYPFVLLFALITGLSLWEFFSITLEKNQRRDRLRKLLGLSFGLTPFVMVSLVKLEMITSPQEFILTTALLCLPFFFLSFVYELFTNSKDPFGNVAILILGLVYIGIPFAMVEFIAFDGDFFRANVVFGLLLLTWSNDTAAYLVGSQIGKTKLFPRISPNKTWEGSIGGAVITLLLGIAMGYIFTELTCSQWLILALIVVIFGSIGDLVESMLKRSYQVKDSGNLLPGHGGMLDRFDAFIFLIPFASAYLLWIRL